MKMVITIAASLMITACGGTYLPNGVGMLPDTLQVGKSILSRDTIEPTAYPLLNHDQRTGLAGQLSLEVPDSTQIIGARPVNNGITLNAYKVPTDEDPRQFKVYFVTCSSKGDVIDWIDLGEFHTSEHDGPMRFGGNRFHTTDASVTFDDATHFTLHRVMTLTSLFLKDHTLTEQWRAEWDNRFEIDASGRFLFTGQQLTTHTDPYNDDIVTEYMSRDRKAGSGRSR